MQKRTSVELWAVCQECSDQFSMTVWVRPDPRAENAWRGFVEQSRELYVAEGKPRHRCGGTLKVYGNTMKITLEE